VAGFVQVGVTVQPVLLPQAEGVNVLGERLDGHGAAVRARAHHFPRLPGVLDEEVAGGVEARGVAPVGRFGNAEAFEVPGELALVAGVPAAGVQRSCVGDVAASGLGVDVLPDVDERLQRVGAPAFPAAPGKVFGTGGGIAQGLHDQGVTVPTVVGHDLVFARVVKDELGEAFIPAANDVALLYAV